MQYRIMDVTGTIIPGITVDESAKEEFKLMVNWNELKWKQRTVETNDS